MDDINKHKLTEQKNKIEKEKNIKNQIKDIEKDVIKSKKELDEINKNLNLLIQYNKDKKQIKYKSKENLLDPNLFRNKNISYLNNIDNNINHNINHNNNKYQLNNANNLIPRQNKMRKINNKIIDMNLNFNDFTNNKPIYMNHKSSRPNTGKYLPTINGPRNYKDQNDKQGLGNNNENIRYNIFSNYNNNDKLTANNNRNNYYFNNCNFINNNLNENEFNYNNKYNNYISNPYNNNYLRNPYNNNYNLYNNYNQIYKEYFNNFMKYLSLRNEKNDKENKNNITENKINDIEISNENKKRKIIYEKINIQKDGKEYKYQIGPAKIQYVGGGNYYNQCHKAIIRNNLGNNNKNYGIQNLFSNGTKQKSGPRIILPNKMFG